MSDLEVPVWTVGDRMRKARVVRHISVEGIADMLSRSRNTVTNWETGRTRPPVRVVKRWSEICRVPYEWLVSGSTQDGNQYEWTNTWADQLDLFAA